MRRLNIKGTSLVETMIAVFIFMFVVAGLLTVMVASNRSWQTYDRNIRVQREVRKTVMAVTRDLRAASGISIVENSGDITVTFTQSGVGNVSYVWANSGSSANQIIKTTPTATRIIARDISDFSVTNATNDYTVDVTSSVTDSQGNLDSFQLGAKVAKRS